MYMPYVYVRLRLEKDTITEAGIPRATYTFMYRLEVHISLNVNMLFFD